MLLLRVTNFNVFEKSHSQCVSPRKLNCGDLDAKTLAPWEQSAGNAISAAKNLKNIDLNVNIISICTLEIQYHRCVFEVNDTTLMWLLLNSALDLYECLISSWQQYFPLSTIFSESYSSDAIAIVAADRCSRCRGVNFEVMTMTTMKTFGVRVAAVGRSLRRVSRLLTSETRFVSCKITWDEIVTSKLGLF